MMPFSRKYFFGCRPDRFMKTMIRILPLGAVCLAFTLQAATLNEWNFYSDPAGKTLSQSVNSAGTAVFAAGNETGLTTDGLNNLICTQNDPGTTGMWTNGAILKAALSSPVSSGVQYLRYDFSYDLSSASNDSGCVAGFTFYDGTNNKIAGVALQYDVGANTNPTYQVTQVTEMTNMVGTVAVVAKINLSNQTLSVWYNLNGDVSSFSESAPATNITTSLSSFDSLRFQATGDIRATASTNYVAIDLLRTANSWTDILIADPAAPPSLHLQMTDSLSGAMEVGETNKISVVIRNVGGLASNVTSALSHDGSASSFTVTSNVSVQVLWPGESMTNTFDAVANTNGSYLFTATGLIGGVAKTSTNLEIVVGSQISYLSNSIAEVSGGMLPGTNEPSEIVDITVFSTNNGARPVSNVVNSISANPAYFSISNLTSSSYLSMPVGASTSTIYRVVISPAATNGTYWFSVANQSGSQVWTTNFALNVFSQGIPSVSPTSITMNVLPGAEATNTQVTVTNAGNKELTFNITDNASWGVSYVATTGSSAYEFVETANANAIKLNDPDTNSVNIEAATDGVSGSQSIGFGFPLNGVVYSNFYVTADGYIGLSNTTNVPAKSLDRKAFPAAVTDPLIAPFWGALNCPSGSVRVIRQYDYLVVSYVGVSKSITEANLQFQAALYTNGAVEFRYKNIAGVTNSSGVTNVTIGIQSSAGSYTNLSFTPGNNTQLKLTPQSTRWVSYSPSQNVTVGPQSSQIITFIANAAGKPAGTSTNFNAIFNWSTGGSNVVAVTVNVTNAAPVYSAVSSLSFTGAAGQVTLAPFVISNIGAGSLTFSISNAASASAGFITTNPSYSWIDISPVGVGKDIDLIDPDPSPYITAEDEGSSAMIPIGFAFPFYGGSYTQLSVSANGAVRFDTAGRIRVLQNIASSKSVMPAQMLAPYWGELEKDANATLKYHANADRFVITWENFRQYGVGGGSNLTFQAIITPAGDITFQYKKLEGAPWPGTIIGLRDTADRTPTASILQTNDWTVTNSTYSGTIYTQYVGVVSNRVVQFQPKQIQVIRYTPASGSIAAGSNAVITIIGDASNQSIGTTNSSTNATLSITHNATNMPSPTSLAVTFTATNSQETVFARASALADDSDGDGVTDDAERIAGTDPQSAGSVFTVSTAAGRVLSWPSAEGRTYTVWYTLDLTIPFETLPGASGLGINLFTDTAHTDAAVIYYKVTVD